MPSMKMGLMANGVKSKEHHQIWDTLDWKKNWHVGILCRDHPKNHFFGFDFCLFSIFVPTCEGKSHTYGARWRT